VSYIVLTCPLCVSGRVRVVNEQPNRVACACDACFAQFTIEQPIERIERRRVPRTVAPSASSVRPTP
jgi:hypothetical protein